MNLIIFDLDGTLIDSQEDLANAVNAMRGSMDQPALPHDRIATYVGNGAPVLVRRALGEQASDAQVAAGLEFFLRHYREHMLDSTRLYPGVQETLDALRGGYRLAILTNKPVRISEAIIAGLGLTDYFFRIYGGNSFEQKKPHPIGIERLLDETALPAEKALMVGDSAVDVQTARNGGIRVCGVSYGFQPDVLAAEAPDYLIAHFNELPRVLTEAAAG